MALALAVDLELGLETPVGVGEGQTLDEDVETGAESPRTEIRLEPVEDGT
jgi:hypothetical protein